MAVFRPFPALRPRPEKAADVACRPYDVMNSAEARIEAKDCPDSFLHVIKAEIDLPEDLDTHDRLVYQKAKENLEQAVEKGLFQQDSKPGYSIYQLEMDGHVQTGFVGCASVEDYEQDIIKKHELTRPDKEQDRVDHIDTLSAQAEPVFLAHPSNSELSGLVHEVTQGEPWCNFVAVDGIRHTLWVVNEDEKVSMIESLFSKVPALYVADGHHRTAASARVGKARREANPNHAGNEEYNFLLAVTFPEDELNIIDYNRVVKDLNGLDSGAFLNQLARGFEVGEPSDKVLVPERHQMTMYLDGKWRLLKAKPHTYNDDDPIEALDVTILYEQVLKPMLGIENLRTDSRIDFVGGARGPEELKRRVDSGEMSVAFYMHAVEMRDVIRISDAGRIMPPKTTWFEPKLRSGLFIHRF